MVVAVYSVLYCIAVGLDHLSTVLAIDLGGSESNPFFGLEDGSLSHVRAVAVFVILWPMLIGCLWVGRRRAIFGDLAWKHPLADRIIGRTAYSALRVPVVVAIIKALAGLFNIANSLSPVTSTALLRTVIAPLGIWSPTLGYALSAGLLLTIAVGLARWPTQYLLETFTPFTTRKDLR